MESLQQLLGRAKEDIKRSPNLPVGHYRFRVEQHTISERGESSEIVAFRLTAVAAQEDVDADEIEALGKPIEQLSARHEFWFSKEEDRAAQNDDTLFRLDEFLSQLGASAEDNESVQERLPMTTKAEFIGQVIHQPRKSAPEIIDQRIAKTFAVDDFVGAA